MTKFYSVISKFNTVMPYYTQPAHTACQTQDWLKVNCTDFIAKDEWPPNSPDLNSLDNIKYGVQCFSSGISQTSLIAQDHSRAKKCTAADLKIPLVVALNMA